MRILPILSALIVAAVLYLVVFERDSLLAFATGKCQRRLRQAHADRADRNAGRGTTGRAARGGSGAEKSMARAGG